MELTHRLEALLTLAEELGLDVRAEPMGGDGGGLCKLWGRLVLFVDVSADVATRYDRTLTAMAALPDWEDRFVIPELRADLEHQRNILNRARP